ncbi:MAG TPA: histidine kinase [Amycolatopsis sp.]|uniref:sensor histidine kinase n=1 Tax=Amycolatopsis sp. TaxID=37632 RepID=UPI002B468586|nr:histidine kinase [Amycolatopsis sp.]HKS44448.1 histidine kinase [Amycolatopsis sp.]
MRGMDPWMRAARSHPFVMDVALAATLCAVTLITSAVDLHHGWTANATAVLAAAVAYGATIGRRRRPMVALAVSVAAAAAFMAVSRSHGLVVMAPLIVLYHLAVAAGDRRRVLVAGAVAVLVLAGVPEFVTHVLGSGGPWLDAAKLAIAAACGLALAAGDATRSRRAYVAEVEERARRAETGRELEARRRVVEERLRIARDLHDSMGHHIAVINAQAGLATHVFDDRPATARHALTTIKQASRAALDDLRDTVGLLRQPGESATPTEPALGVGGVGDLVASLRGAGMRIDQQVEGSIRPLPPAIDLTAYRVVQEALTNVGKHAPGAPAHVRLCYQPTALRIVVEDDGNGRGTHRGEAPLLPAGDGAGHGIQGMRERVEAIDGSLDATARPAGGFRVSAVLPLPAGDRT